jgi:hypothetical protein
MLDFTAVASIEASLGIREEGRDEGDQRRWRRILHDLDRDEREIRRLEAIARPHRIPHEPLDKIQGA